MTPPLYGFTEDSVIPEGIIKLAITLGKPPRTGTVMIDLLTMNCLSAFNRVFGTPLLKALKAVPSIHYLIIKFPIAAGTNQVRGRQCYSREFYSRSLRLTEKEPELPQAMEVERRSRGQMETNINPHLQEDESTTGPIKVLTEI